MDGERHEGDHNRKNGARRSTANYVQRRWINLRQREN
jgi:hypothetical protein